MFKNVASQKLIVYAFDSTTNLPKTGDSANLTAYVSKDYGSVTVLGDTSATEMDSTNAKGYYLFDLTQAETNGDCLMFSCKSSTANIVVVAAPAVVYTVPANFTAQSIDSSGRVDVIKIAGTTQTARDIGASVLLSSGTGTGQVSLSSGTVTVGTNNDKTGYSLSAGGVQAIWDALTSALNTASSIGKLLVDNINATISSRSTYAGGDTSGTTTLLSRLTSMRAGYLDNLTNLDVASSTLDAKLDAIDDYIDTEVAAIKAKTDNLPASPAAVSDIPSAATIATTVWDKATSALTTSGSVGKLVVDNVDATVSSRLASGSYTAPDNTSITAIKAKTDNLPASPAAVSDIPSAATVASTVWDNATSGIMTAGSIGKQLKDNVDVVLSTRLASSSYTAPDNSSITAIKAKTDNLPASPAAVSDIPTATQNADALLNRDMSAVTVTNSRSPINAMRVLRNKVTTAGGTLTVYKEDDSTSAWTGTLTTDGSATPITGVDPA